MQLFGSENNGITTLLQQIHSRSLRLPGRLGSAKKRAIARRVRRHFRKLEERYLTAEHGGAAAAGDIRDKAEHDDADEFVQALRQPLIIVCGGEDDLHAEQRILARIQAEIDRESVACADAAAAGGSEKQQASARCENRADQAGAETFIVAGTRRPCVVCCWRIYKNGREHPHPGLLWVTAPTGLQRGGASLGDGELEEFAKAANRITDHGTCVSEVLDYGYNTESNSGHSDSGAQHGVGTDDASATDAAAAAGATSDTLSAAGEGEFSDGDAVDEHQAGSTMSHGC